MPGNFLSRLIRPSCRWEPTLVDLEVVVQEAVEGTTEEQIARVGGRGPCPRRVKQTGRHARFADQFRAEVAPPVAAMRAAHEVSAKRPPTPKRRQLHAQAEEGEA